MSLDQYRTKPLRPDWLFGLQALGLALLGLVMVLSASAYLAGTTGDVYQFVSRQSLSLILALIVMVIMSVIDYRVWRAAAPIIFIGLIILLIGVFISPECRNVHRCLDLGPLTIQPTELVKAGFVIYLAAWLTKIGPAIRDFRSGVIPFGVLLGVVGGLIMLQPDMGTTVTLLLASVIMFFLAGARISHMALGGVLGVGLLMLLILIAPYRAARLETFLNPGDDPLGAGYQTTQIGIAIGSGGLWGLGFGQGKLKYLGYVPEVHTDSIFAVVVEELGFLRAFIILAIILWFILRGYKIARGSPDPFGRLLGAGMITLIAAQTFINLSAMLHLVPLTGVPLPFISYGGSSLVATFAAVGILLSISKSRGQAA